MQPLSSRTVGDVRIFLPSLSTVSCWSNRWLPEFDLHHGVSPIRIYVVDYRHDYRSSADMYTHRPSRVGCHSKNVIRNGLTGGVSYLKGHATSNRFGGRIASSISCLITEDAYYSVAWNDPPDDPSGSHDTVSKVKVQSKLSELRAKSSLDGLLGLVRWGPERPMKDGERV